METATVAIKLLQVQYISPSLSVIAGQITFLWELKIPHKIIRASNITSSGPAIKISYIVPRRSTKLNNNFHHCTTETGKRFCDE